MVLFHTHILFVALGILSGHAEKTVMKRANQTARPNSFPALYLSDGDSRIVPVALNLVTYVYSI